jgi:hypothetical protein
MVNVYEMEVTDPSYRDDTLKNIIQYFSINPEDIEKNILLN